MLYADMLRGVIGRVKGCPESEAEDAMRNACIEFCSETYCIVNGAEVIATGEPAEAISMADLFVLAVIDARIAGVAVAVLAMNDDIIADATAEYPVIVFAEPSSLYVVPAPTTPVLVDLMVAVAPGPDSTEIPDFVWQRHHESLKYGALSRLLAEPDKPWTDTNTASWYEQKFRDAITKQAALGGRNRIHRAQRLRVKPA